MRLTHILLSSFFLCLFCGCASTAQHRDRQYANDWDGALSQRIQQGVIAQGDTRLMVYVAYGPPLYQPILTDRNRERWEYLGSIKPRPELLRPLETTSVCFSSTNDVRFENPFQTQNSLKTLVVEFDEQGKVVSFSLFPAPAGSRVTRPDSTAFRLPDLPKR